MKTVAEIQKRIYGRLDGDPCCDGYGQIETLSREVEAIKDVLSNLLIVLHSEEKNLSLASLHTILSYYPTFTEEKEED